MTGSVGIDVGSTTAKVVVLCDAGRVVHAECVRHGGQPVVAVQKLLARAVNGQTSAQRRGVTGSIGVALADSLAATPIHEVQAVTLAARARLPDCRSVIELGGQDAKIVSFGPDRTLLDVQMNDRCAAGTGATIDRILRRIGLNSETLAELALSGDLRIAAKCGVFAETDLINLLQRGASHAAVLSALARAIVVQNLAVLARGRVPLAPVLLLGGPHAHWPLLREAWELELLQLWAARGYPSGAVLAPKDGQFYVAIGAALHAQNGGRALLRVKSTQAAVRDDGPLLTGAHGEDALRVAVAQSTPAAVRAAPAPRAGALHLGLDAGSTSVKAVLLDGSGQLVADCYRPATGQPLADARSCLVQLLESSQAQGLSEHVGSFGITGYGAQLLAPLLGADHAPVETVAHARAVREVLPHTQVIVDIGGTDIKVLQLSADGSVAQFFVSNQCSAGHGAFLAATAADLGIPLSEFAERALCARRAPRFSLGCAIFMDSDRVTFQRDGYSAEEILAGLCWALARNVWEFVVPEAPERLGVRFALTGGAQRNWAAALAQARYLRARVPGAEVHVPAHPELCGARGAALIARDALEANGCGTRFVGLAALAQLSLQVQSDESLRCRRCEVGCARSTVTVRAADRVSRWLIGNACERGAELTSHGRRSRTHAPDLFAGEVAGLFRWPATSTAPKTRRRWPVIGVPRVLGMYRAAPLLLGYVHAAGMPRSAVVLSPTTTAALFQDGSRSGVNDPCFPAKLVHAHVEWLLRNHARQPIDGLLMPAFTHAAVPVRGVTDSASCPIVAACGHIAHAALRRGGDRLRDLGIAPLLGELCLVDPARLSQQLEALLGTFLELSPDQHRTAFARALAWQAEASERRRQRGARILAWAQGQGRAVALVLSRPYHADPGVQHAISTQLAAAGIPVLCLSSLPLTFASLADLSDTLPELTNSGSSEKLWAARAIANHPNLVAVDISSFRCGQDASILGELTALLASPHKPVLWLHDLDEDRPSASLSLRIETFVAALRRYETRLHQVSAPNAKGAVCTTAAQVPHSPWSAGSAHLTTR